MGATLRGGCACGAVRYECTTAPMLSVLCHCRDCQRSTGSGYAAELVVRESGFSFVKCTPRYHLSTGDSGNVVRRGFRPECGSPLVTDSSGRPGFLAIQVGSLEDPPLFRPTHHVYAPSAQPWDQIGPEMSAFSKIPDAEQVFMRLIELKVKTRQEASIAIKDLFRNETLVSDEGAEALVPQRRTATCYAPLIRSRIALRAVIVGRRAAIVDTGSTQGVIAFAGRANE